MFKAGEDLIFAAFHNIIPLTTAHRLGGRSRIKPAPRGTTRTDCMKFSPEIEAVLEEYVDENCM